MSIEAKNIHYHHKGLPLLQDISLSIPNRKITAIIGPNGAGKSTLLKILSGDMSPQQGHVYYQDVDIATLSLNTLAGLRSVVNQHSNVAFDFSVEDIVLMGWLPQQSGEYLAIAFTEVCRQCQLQQLLPRSYNTLSGGEKQRVQFARALLQIWQPQDEAQNPRYLLLDEPTASLDVGAELQLLRMTSEKACANTGILIVLHDLNLAARFGDQLLLMHQGRLVAAGTPEQVLTPRLLTEVYQTPIGVTEYPHSDRLLICT